MGPAGAEYTAQLLLRLVERQRLKLTAIQRKIEDVSRNYATPAVGQHRRERHLYMTRIADAIANVSRAIFRRFLPRDAMHKRGLCRHAVSVCLSARSVTFVNCVKTNKNIFEIFSHHLVAKPF